MAVDGKLTLLGKMIQACFDKYAKENNKAEWNPVLMYVMEAKFYKDVPLDSVRLQASFLVLMLQKVLSYKVKAICDNEVVAEAMIGFGEG